MGVVTWPVVESVVAMVVGSVVGVVASFVVDVVAGSVMSVLVVMAGVIVGAVSSVGCDVGVSIDKFRGTVVSSLLAVICLPKPHPGVVHLAPINTAPGLPHESF